MSLISATHWVWSEYEPGFHAGETRVFGTLQAARMWAVSVVPDCVTTNDCYWRDTARGEHVDFTLLSRPRRPYSFTRGRCLPRNVRPAGCYKARVIIVPSCGELGWAP